MICAPSTEVQICPYEKLHHAMHTRSMSIDADQILSLNLSDEILRKFLRGKMIDVANAVGVECAVRISCELPMEVITIHSPSEPDDLLKSVVGEANSLKIARTLGGSKTNYVQVPRSFTSADLRKLQIISALLQGKSVDVVSRTFEVPNRTVSYLAEIFEVGPWMEGKHDAV